MSPTSEKPVVVSLVGDCLIQHRCSTLDDPGLHQVAQILRESDFAFANLEGNLQDGEDWPGFVAGHGGFGSPYLSIPPAMVDELKWFGIDFVSTANNHASDFAEAGILTTLRHLDAAGIGHAGTGANLTQATAPGYAYFSKGRIAVVAAADNGVREKGEIPFPVPRGCMAADQGPWFKDRPGVNMLRFEPVFDVDAQTMAALRRASELIGWDKDKDLRKAGGGLLNPSVGASILDRREDTDSVVHFNGTKFRVGSEFGFETLPFEEDLQRNFKWIAEARRNADIVIASLHQQGASPDPSRPSDYVRIFAKGAIDAGADIFVAHGDGKFGGVEIYKGKAILYGLPGFISQLLQRTKVPLEQVRRLGLPDDATPADVADLTIRSFKVALERDGPRSSNPSGGLALYSVLFGKDGVEKILVYPLERLRRRRGESVPALAKPGSPVHRAVLDLLKERSAPYGTVIQEVDGVAVIDVSATR